MLSLPSEDSLVSNSMAMRELLSLIPKVAHCDLSVLITGESGTGKELLAKKLHAMSPRAPKPLISVNCASFPNDLLESELFGHKKGSFTGAISDHRGLFELADQGTLFLDEIGDMPLSLQAKLLRVLQEKKIRSIGTGLEKFVDFKLIAATHRDLRVEMRKGSFRGDLFFRLSVVPLKIPPLRERPEDIPDLVEILLAKASEKLKIRSPKISQEAIKDLRQRPWPGNVRELENTIGRILVIHQGKELIEVDDLPPCEDFVASREGLNFVSMNERPTVQQLSEDYFKYILKSVGYNQTEAARILGLSRRTINRKLRQNLPKLV